MQATRRPDQGEDRTHDHAVIAQPSTPASSRCVSPMFSRNAASRDTTTSAPRYCASIVPSARPDDRSRWLSGSSSSNCRAGRSAYKTTSEEHTPELQSLMRNAYAAFCLTQLLNNKTHSNHI